MWRVAVRFFAILFGLSGVVAPLPDSLPPNIILILADDLGFNDVGFHGGEIATPNIDALGYQGIILNKHYTAPVCTPSRAALLTGNHPSDYGLQGAPPIAAGRPIALPPDQRILPEYLKELGYSTHLIGKWHLGSYLRSQLPMERGFDSHFGFWNGYIGHYDGVHATSQTGPKGLDFHRGIEPAWNESYGRYITDLLTDEAGRVIREHGRKGGLFLMITHAAPHTGNPGDTLLPPPPRGNPNPPPITDPKRRIYADIVRVLDEGVGTVVKELSEADMLDNSIVIFLSDNGAPSVDPIYNFGNAGSNWPLRGEKVSSHEGGTRVAAVVWSPLFQRPGRVFHQLFSSVDWLPTLVSAAGGRVSRQVDGVDQWEALKLGNLPPVRDHMLVELNDDSYAIIQGPWKLIKNFPRSSKFAPADDFTGDSGRGLIGYNVSEVWSSPAAIAARRAQPFVVPQSRYTAIRKEAMVDCGPERGSGPGVACHPVPCLFDLVADPCEMRDVKTTYPEIVTALTASLKPYMDRARPKLFIPTDPAADPRCWGNAWSTWRDPAVITTSTCMKSTPLQRFIAQIRMLLNPYSLF